ncbi:hypothetical protein chiPu_0028487, partial [Chiloscyllium punctatum]|nr:hypothetical protein [Chiloscyllium punctatum]
MLRTVLDRDDGLGDIPGESVLLTCTRERGIGDDVRASDPDRAPETL